MLHTKSPLIHGKIKLKCLTIYGYGSHLGHVTNVMSMYFHFNVPKNLYTKFGYNGPVVSEKSKF